MSATSQIVGWYEPDPACECGKCAQCIVDSYTPQGAWVNDEPEPESPNQKGGMMRLIQIADPEGTYCCHLTRKELRKADQERQQRDGFKGYRIRFGDAALDEPKLDLTAGCAKYPNLTPEEEQMYLDTASAEVVQAYNRYTSIAAKAEAAKKRLTGKALDKRLTYLRWEWVEVREDTGVEFSECQDTPMLEGREGDARIKRDEAEVSYCHRDPSDWQITHETPEEIMDAVRLARDAALAMDEDFTWQDGEDLREHLLALHYRRQITQLWKRLFAALGEDWQHGRLVTHRIMRKGDETKTVPTREVRKAIRNGWTMGAVGVDIGEQEFVERKIAEQGSELDGLRKAVDSLRFRIVKERERKEREAAYQAKRLAKK